MKIYCLIAPTKESGVRFLCTFFYISTCLHHLWNGLGKCLLYSITLIGEGVEKFPKTVYVVCEWPLIKITFFSRIYIQKFFQFSGYEHYRQSNFLQRFWTFIWCFIILWTRIHFTDFRYYDFLICRSICTKFLIGRNCYLFCGKGKK